MQLNQLKDEFSPRKDRKRVGRGIGSGTGKTCGSGHKGQKSRSGVSINGFEGGQTPIYRRIPKRGFVNIHRVEFQKINVGDLQKFVDAKRIDPKKTIDTQTLYDAGIIKKFYLPIKLLAKGELKSSLTLEVDAASKTAIELIEKAGGKVVLTTKKTEAA